MKTRWTKWKAEYDRKYPDEVFGNTVQSAVEGAPVAPAIPNRRTRWAKIGAVISVADYIARLAGWLPDSPLPVGIENNNELIASRLGQLAGTIIGGAVLGATLEAIVTKVAGPPVSTD